MSITTSEYRSFQKAYDFFNGELFEKTLPEVLITLQRKSKAAGFFVAERFKGRLKETVAHELAMNPDTFRNETDRQILQTLVHEMCHVWQHCFGHPTRARYHNREWAEKMKMVGLQPSSTGKPGGRETGQRISDYIIEGGPYAQGYDCLARTGFKLTWNSRPDPIKRRESKHKFCCPKCNQNAWAKPDASLVCGLCLIKMRSAAELNGVAL
jgi:hypothetical protein